MDENKNPIKNRLSEKLPSHAPDDGTWQSISAKLDAIDADVVYHEKLEKLPSHTPDPGTWNSILFRLNRASYLKTGLRVALSAAAVMLLFFAITQISDTYNSASLQPDIAGVTKHDVSASKEISSQSGKLGNESYEKTNAELSLVKAETSAIDGELAVKEVLPVEAQVKPSFSDNDFYISPDMPVPDENATEMLAGITFIEVEPGPGSDILKTIAVPSTSILMSGKNQLPVSPPVKYYSPAEPKSGNKKNNFALSMNYLPENIDNGTDMSLFHNVDLTASYNKEKVRFNTSLGMAYNEEQIVFDMNYDINIPVTAPGPGGNVDTVGYAVEALKSQYEGTEKHQYFTYNLGIGRRIFSAGKFSTWFSAGAGFGIRLNDPDIIASTEKNIINQYNANITSQRPIQPVYNDVNINFVTGIDFSYKFFNRLSLTFTPTSRWYFKPVLTKNNQATDELTLGFKTGMKFDF